MSLSEDGKGPEQETAPAPSPSRDFDGGLIRRWSYTLTRADALALLRLRREWSGRAKLGFGLVCLAGGALAGLLAPGDSLFIPFLLIEAWLIAALFAGRDLWRRRRAARLVPQPRPALLEEWIDCIAGTVLDEPDEAYLSHELIGQVLLTRTHLFIRSHGSTIVVPRTAFEGDAEAEAFAAHVTQLSRGPYYFELQD